MDIRVRLLLAFTPLLLLLVGTSIALEYANRDFNALLNRQMAAADSLAELRALEASMLREHSAVVQIVKGEAEAANRLNFTEARRDSQTLRMQRETSNLVRAAQEPQLLARIDELSQRHDTIVQLVSVSARTEAKALLGDPLYNRMINEMVTRGDAARDELRSEFDAATLALAVNQRTTLTRAAIATLIAVILSLLFSWLLVGGVARPLERLSADARRLSSGDLKGELSPSGNVTQIRRLRDAFQHLIDANRVREQRIATGMAELQAQVEREERLRETVQALSVTVVPLQAETLLLPLVGHLDERRANELTTTVLKAIYERRARLLVIDLTGLATLDTQTAGYLQRAAEAARLLGCRVTLVGVRAEQATLLAGNDLAASGITIARDIPSVLAQAGMGDS